MVGPADKPAPIGPHILVIEIRICVIVSLGGLRVHKIDMGRYGSPVDVSLIAADVYSGELHHGERGLYADRVPPLTVGGGDDLHGVGARVGDLLRMDRRRDELRRGHPDLLAGRGSRPYRFRSGLVAGWRSSSAGHLATAG